MSSPVRHQQNIQHELLQQLHRLRPLGQVERGGVLGVRRVLHVVQSGDQQVHQAEGRRKKKVKKY